MNSEPIFTFSFAASTCMHLYTSIYWYCIIFYIVNEWRTGHLKTSSNLRKGGSLLALNLSSHKSWGAQLPFTEGRKQPRRCQIACEVCRELMSFQYQLLAGKWTTWMNTSTNPPQRSTFPIFAKHIHKNIISMQWYIITYNYSKFNEETTRKLKSTPKPCSIFFHIPLKIWGHHTLLIQGCGTGPQGQDASKRFRLKREICNPPFAPLWGVGAKKQEIRDT